MCLPLQAFDLEEKYFLPPENKPNPIPLTFSQKLKALISKICSAIVSALYFLMNLVLFVANPSFYAIGFLAGTVFSQNMSDAIRRITQTFTTQKLFSACVLGFGAFFSLPITLACASFVAGGNLGVTMSAHIPLKVTLHQAVPAA